MKNKHVMVLSSLFIVLTLLILFNLTVGIDTYIYEKIALLINENLTTTIIFITDICSILTSVIIALIVALVLIKSKKIKTLKIFTLTLVIGNVLNFLLKILIARQRPDILQLVVESTKSFPSGHAYISTLLYGLIMILINKYTKNKYKYFMLTIYIIFILLIGFTRIYLGVHYFTDILGGYLFGTITLLIVYPLLMNTKD